MFTKEQILGKFLAALRKDVANPFPVLVERFGNLYLCATTILYSNKRLNNTCK